MFKWLVGFLLLSSYAQAELPYQVTDPATMHNLEYLDANDGAAVKKTGSTMSGPLTLVNSNVILSSNTAATQQPAICFADGTCQQSAGTGVMAISANAQQFTGNGLVATPLTLNASSVTLMGLLSSIAQITNHSHTVLTDIGTRSHAQLESDIALKSPILVGVRFSTDTVSFGLIDGSTITAALALKANTADVIPSTATGTYQLSITGNSANATTAVNFSGSLSGAVTGTQGATVVGNDSHTHNQTTLSGVIQSSATGHYGIAVASADYAPGDDLGNHTAEQNLDMATYNIDGVDRVAMGTHRDYWTGFTEYGREATFEADVLGNAVVQRGSQIFAQNEIAISSTAVTLPNTVSVSVDCVTAGCGYSDSGSGLISDNGTYFRFYGGAGDSIIIQTAYNNVDVPANSTVIGAQGFIEKYSNNPSGIVTGVYEGTDASYCKITTLAPNAVYGKNQCAANDWQATSSTHVYGNSSYSWDYQITPAEANSTNNFGWVQSIKLIGNATAYIDVMKFQLFYIDNDAFKMSYNTNKLSVDYGGNPVLYVSTYNSVGIMKQPVPGYTLDMTGSVNSSGGFFKNGVEVGGSTGGADNLGSHTATMTITGNYGASISTLVVTGSQFSVGGSTLVVANGRVSIGTSVSTATVTISGDVGKPALVVKRATDSTALELQQWRDASDNVRMEMGDISPVDGSPALKIISTNGLAGGVELALVQNEAGLRTYGGYFYVTPTTSDMYWASRTNMADNIRLYVKNSNGYTGINTSAPDRQLQVIGGIESATASGATRTTAYLNASATSADLDVYDYDFGPRPLQLNVNGGSVYVDPLNSGSGTRLGVGTNAPVAKLGVVGNADISLGLNVGGDVGIGTTGPGAKLEVNGNIVSSGTINAQNGLCINNVCKSVWGAGTGDAVLAATQTFTGTTSFTSLSTTTFSGTVDIGYQIVTNSCGGPSNCSATCPTGKIVLGGGCSADGSTVPQSNRPLGNTGWYCAAVNSNWNVWAICARVKP